MPTRRDPRAPCRPNDAPSLHERLIRQLIDGDERMCRNGFGRALRQIIDDEELDVPESITRMFLPDAYLIDHEAREIRMYEVEVTCPMNAAKQADYAWFWFVWDCELPEAGDWDARLFVVNRYGHCNEMNLERMYLGSLAERNPQGPIAAMLAMDA